MAITPDDITPDDITPDDKDWTWTLERRCPECSFDARTVPVDAIAGETLRLTAPWAEVLARPDVRTRPRPDVWSPLEYACHVRDVCQVFAGRVDLMLSHDETGSQAQFDNWDQDATAIEQRYADQDPAEVAVRLREAAVRASAAFAAVGAVGHRPVGATGAAEQRLGVHRRHPRPVLPARPGAPPRRRRRLRGDRARSIGLPRDRHQAPA